jgi:hypothetical protein
MIVLASCKRFLFALVLLSVASFPSISLAEFCPSGALNVILGGSGDVVLGGGFNGVWTPDGVSCEEVAQSIHRSGIAPWSIGYLGGLGLPGADGTSSITGIIAGLLSWFLMIFGFLAILGFLVSGSMYIIGFGDEGLMKRGKQGMIYSIIGVIVGLSGYIIIQTIVRVLAVTPEY